MSLNAEPRRAKPGESVHTDSKYELVLTAIRDTGAALFRVRPRGAPAEGAEDPAATVKKSWEFELTAGESEVVPLIRDRKARVLLTMLAHDTRGEVRVVASRATARLPRVLKDDLTSGDGPPVKPAPRGKRPAPEGESCGPQCQPAGAASGEPGEERDQRPACNCPLCVGRATYPVTTTRAQRLLLHMGLGRLAKDITEHPWEADRVACDVGIVTTEPTAPVLLRLVSSVIEATPR